MLQRRSPLKRSPLSRSSSWSKRTARFTVPPGVRQALKIRSGGLCEARLPGCAGQATDVCHRIARKMGGRPDDFHRLSNVWHGCRTCHRWATDNPAEAYDLGLALKEWQNPEREPIAYQNAGFVVLDDCGGLWPWGDAA